jgi:hypothetical protein
MAKVGVIVDVKIRVLVLREIGRDVDTPYMWTCCIL